MAYSRLLHKGAAVSNTLSSSISDTATSITLSTNPTTSWPSVGAPFFCVVNPGTAKEEKICVVRSSDTTLTVVDETDYTDPWAGSVNGRGVDDTTARSHDAGAVIYPVFTAREANQANELVSSYTDNGDIVVHGATSFKKIAVGSNDNVLIADSSVADGGVKWGTVPTAGITNSAVTAAKLASNAVETVKINDLAVTTAKIADDAVTQAKIGAGAVGATELADNAVTNAKIDSSAVDTAELADGAVETAKINDAAVTAAKLASDAIGLVAPTGSIMQFAGSSTPTGWLTCDGSEVAIATYTALYNILTATGTVFPFGANTNGSGGAGSTHFLLPNFKGRVPVGRDAADVSFDVLGETGGAKTHTLTTAEIPAHTHTVSQNDAGSHTHTILGDGSHDHDVPTRTTTNTSHTHIEGDRAAGAPSPSNLNDTIDSLTATHGHTTSDPGNHSHSVSITSSGGSGGSHNNLQPYIVINYIVKT